MKINIITCLPNYFDSTICSILKRSMDAGLWSLNIINIKDYGIGRHKKIDDKSYGGGCGLILRPDVLSDCIEKNNLHKTEIFLTSPRGKTFTQTMAKKLSNKQEITIITNRFEGVDQRVIDYYNMNQVSIGKFILLGGEAAAATIIEATIRLIDGVILNPEATKEETFSSSNFIEHDHYTKPDIWKNIIVPSVLKSGNHKEIHNFRKKK